MNKRNRRSAPRRGSSSRKQPPEVFVDRSLGGKVVPDALRAAHPDVVVLAHDDVFAADTDDDVWLRAAGEEGWVVLTKDEAITRKPGAHEAIISTRVRGFCLHPSRGLIGPAMGEILADALPKLLRIAESRKRGTGFLDVVDRRGRVRRLYP